MLQYTYVNTKEIWDSSSLQIFINEMDSTFSSSRRLFSSSEDDCWTLFAVSFNFAESEWPKSYSRNENNF